MKKILKALAVMLVFTLVIGCVPVSAASSNLSLTKKAKTVFVGGCTGTKANGTKAKFYSYINVRTMVKNFKNKTQDIKLVSGDASIVKVNNSKDRITAVGTGKTKVTVTVTEKKSKKELFKGTITVTVKQNANDSTFTVSGIKDGDSFKVGDSVTVSLTRKDTDSRRLTCSDSSVTIKSAGTRKWTVSFTKAGTYTLLAEAFQSATYKGATYSKQIKVTVAAEEKKEEEDYKVAQTTTASFVITGKEAGDFDKEDFEVYQKTAGIKTASLGVKTVTGKEKTATVTMLSTFTSGSEYFVKIGDKEYSFTAVSTKPADVDAVVLKTQKAYVNETTALELSYYVSGVDVTDMVKSLMTPVFTHDNPEISAFVDTSAGTIYFYEKGLTAAISASVQVGYDASYNPITLKTAGAVVSYEKEAATSTDFRWTLAKSDSTYMSAAETCYTYTCLGDSPSFEALFTYSDKTVKTLKETGYTLKSSNDNVIMISGDSPSGGKLVLPVQTGTAVIMIMNGDKLVQSCDVTVRPKRVPTNITAVQNKQFLNLNAAVGDSISVTAVVKDQYGETMSGQALFCEQNVNTMTATGTVTFPAFIGPKMTITASNVSHTGTSDGIIYTIKCGDAVSSQLRFNVKDVAYDASSSYSVSVTASGETVLDATLEMGDQDIASTLIYAEFKSGDYYVKRTVGHNVTVTPTTTLKASDLGVPAGTTVYYNTISYNNTIINPATNANISATEDCITFTPIVYGSKLAKGNYAVTIFKVTAGETSSTVVPVGTKAISVTETAPVASYIKIAETAQASGSWANILPKFFKFYFNDEEILPVYITDAETVTGSSGATAVKTVTFSLPNDTYGNFTYKLELSGDLLIYIK